MHQGAGFNRDVLRLPKGSARTGAGGGRWPAGKHPPRRSTAMVEIEQPAATDPVRETPWMDFVHTGPGSLAGRFLRSFWQPVYRAEDLRLGRARPLKIMGEDLTLYR